MYWYWYIMYLFRAKGMYGELHITGVQVRLITYTLNITYVQCVTPFVRNRHGNCEIDSDGDGIPDSEVST